MQCREAAGLAVFSYTHTSAMARRLRPRYGDSIASRRGKPPLMQNGGFGDNASYRVSVVRTRPPYS